VIKKFLSSLGQIATETVEKAAEETVNIASRVITGQELVGDIKPMNEAEIAKAKEEEEKKQAAYAEATAGRGRNVEKEIEEVRDEKKKKEEEEERLFLENLKRQREAEEAERNQRVDETGNPEREAKKRQFVPGPKKKQQPDLSQLSQTSEFKGKID
jgi:predicted RNase H-like nuclease (RuvC/YqgF family)